MLLEVPYDGHAEPVASLRARPVGASTTCPPSVWSEMALLDHEDVLVCGGDVPTKTVAIDLTLDHRCVSPRWRPTLWLPTARLADPQVRNAESYGETYMLRP
ncbi:hypothetical protein [Streptomyces sp. GbtcB7]|nr:hypothetical protein [Streptomyces sp. GbtcB7]